MNLKSIVTTIFVLIAIILSSCSKNKNNSESSNASKTVEISETTDPSDTSKWINNIYNKIGVAPVNGGFQMKDYWVWGSTVIKGDDNLYHMFASRWPKYIPFHPGWMVASEIAHAVSNKPEGPYKFVDVALGRRGIQYWDGKSVHNPKIVKYKDKYILYYMGSTNPFPEITPENASQLTHESRWSVSGRWNKRVGIAISESLNGPWERYDEPIFDVKPNTFYNYLTSNPTPLIKKDGSVVLLFKGRGYKEDGTPSLWNIGVATAPSYKGPYTAVTEEPIFSKDKVGVMEDPFLWSDNNGYHMVAKDMTGNITDELHSGVLAHSKDGINWVIDEEPKAYSRKVKWDNGKTEVQGQLERPFILVENGEPTHLFFAVMDGAGGFENGTKTWNMVIPLNNNN